MQCWQKRSFFDKGSCHGYWIATVHKGKTRRWDWDAIGKAVNPCWKLRLNTCAKQDKIEVHQQTCPAHHTLMKVGTLLCSPLSEGVTNWQAKSVRKNKSFWDSPSFWVGVQGYCDASAWHALHRQALLQGQATCSVEAIVQLHLEMAVEETEGSFFLVLRID